MSASMLALVPFAPSLSPLKLGSLCQVVSSPGSTSRLSESRGLLAFRTPRRNRPRVQSPSDLPSRFFGFDSLCALQLVIEVSPTKFDLKVETQILPFGWSCSAKLQHHLADRDRRSGFDV